MSNTVEIIGTQQVLVTETAVNVVELVVPALAAIVEVSTAGPAGPAGANGTPGAAGADAPVKTVKIDTATSGTIYVGKALQGSAESSAVWTVKRSLFNAAGVRTSIGSAVNVTWTGRSGHTYT